MIELNKFLIQLYNKGIFKDTKSVIELGSKDVWDTPLGLDEFFTALNKYMQLSSIARHIDGSRLSASIMWEALGFEKYECIDVDGVHGAHKFDLNYLIDKKYGFTEKFDVVTNFGTSEHVFNQQAVFENIHNLCKKDGIMIHSVPSQMYLSHGLFNYQPDFFHYLALANDYMPLYAYLVTNKYSIPFSRAACELESKTGQDLGLIIAYRKNGDSAFNFPYQLETAKEFIFDYEVKKRDYLRENLNTLLSLFGWERYQKVAIFGAANAAKNAKEFCDFADIKVEFFIDDFKSGEYLGLKIVNSDIFLSEMQNNVDVVIKGAFQRGGIGSRELFRLQELEIPQFLLN